MATEVQLSADGRYVLVTQDGPVVITQIKTARADSLPMYEHCNRALVDFRLADISQLTLIDLDNLGIGFRKDVPKCMKMALVRTPAQDERRYKHLVNAHKIYGVDMQLFETMTAAQDWLFEVD